MTSTDPEPRLEPLSLSTGASSVAAVASLAAGAIHAAAIGAHSEQQQVVLTFTVLAVLQLGWGVAALMLPGRRWIAGVGAVVNGAAVVGWLLAKTSGIGFITGLEESETLQLADTSAAALALLAGFIAARELLDAERSERARAGRSRPLLPVALFPIMVLTVASMLSTGSHSHADGHGHDGTTGDGHAHTAAPKVEPFVADDPIDLSGIEGVSASEQAEAEDLLRKTLDRLPQFSDVSSLNDHGFYSIGDGLTGAEHYMNWEYVNDDVLLDPNRPESLVVRNEGGKKTLVAAMFMLPEGSTMDDIPEVGGPLIQWHVHNNLCLTDDPVAPTLAFGDLRVGAECECPPPNSKRGNVPMVHVWIVDHPCGPFAALDGIAGGQVAEGEEVLCTEEHAHVTGS